LPDTLKSALNACKKTVVTLPPKPVPGKLRTTSATYTHDIIDAETGKKVATFDRVQTQVELPAGIYEVKFGPQIAYQGDDPQRRELPVSKVASCVPLTSSPAGSQRREHSQAQFLRIDRLGPDAVPARLSGVSRRRAEILQALLDAVVGGIELERFAEVGDGLIAAVQCGENAAAQLVGLQALRIEADRLVEVR
jgi:hypothetical protein